MTYERNLTYFENLSRDGNPFDNMFAENGHFTFARGLRPLLDLEDNWAVIETAAANAAKHLKGEGIEPIRWDTEDLEKRDDYVITTRQALYLVIALIGDYNPACTAALRRIATTAATADDFEYLITGKEDR